MTAQELKNSILQLAVQGKLVPQNAEDEPAAELVKRITAEKQRHISSGAIKKEKPLPPITEDELPFDIPDLGKTHRYFQHYCWRNTISHNKLLLEW